MAKTLSDRAGTGKYSTANVRQCLTHGPRFVARAALLLPAHNHRGTWQTTPQEAVYTAERIEPLTEVAWPESERREGFSLRAAHGKAISVAWDESLVSWGKQIKG